MTDNQLKAARRRNQRLAGAVGLLMAGGIAGGALAATSSASAAGTTTSPSPVTAGPGSHDDTSTPVRPGEKARAGTDLAALKAAALKAVPGGTVHRVETDADGAKYEAHMTKADGTHVTVKLDKNLKVTQVEDGMGAGRAGGDDGVAHHDGSGGHDDGTSSGDDGNRIVRPSS